MFPNTIHHLAVCVYVCDRMCEIVQVCGRRRQELDGERENVNVNRRERARVNHSLNRPPRQRDIRCII